MNINLKERAINMAMEKLYEVSKYDNAILKLYQDYSELQNIKNPFNLTSIKQDFYNIISKIPANDRLKYLSESKINFLWGMKPDRLKSERILNAVMSNEKIYFGEDAFLRCVVGSAQVLKEEEKCYQQSCGYILDDLTAYFDATRPSRMELLINSDFEVSPDNIERSKKAINKIITNKISKYNNQPIYTPSIGRNGKTKVLIIDQSYKDYSIIKGRANDQTFENMLNKAIQENPEADIIIKTHPDTIGTNTLKQKCYYQNIESNNNIYRLTDYINPISLIEYVDKVYVCTSQFGFEALMCNKEVHTFGMPFYAGWGLTNDNLNCERRTRKRSLEELFYIAYIYIPLYINPETNQICEIEEVIDYLIEKREEYFSKILKVSLYEAVKCH